MNDQRPALPAGGLDSTANLTAQRDRRRQRERRVWQAAGAALAARATGFLIALVSIPLTVRYLGTERYGLWVTISSLSAFLGLADLGLGNGLINAIAQSEGKDDRQMAARFTSSSFFLLAALAGAVASLFLLSYQLIPWAQVFNVTGKQARAESGPAVAIFVLTFAAGIPLAVVNKVLFGYQRGLVANLWLAAGNVGALAALLAAIHGRLGLPWLVLAYAAVPQLVAGVNSIRVFFFSMPWTRPRVALVSRRETRALIRVGLLFFVLQAAFAIGYQSDNIVIDRILGPHAVAAYAVPMRLFVVAPTLLGLVLTPLWPAYREALVRGDQEWTIRRVRQSLLAAVGISTVVGGFILVWHEPLLKVLSGGRVRASLSLLVALFAWSVLSSLAGALAMFLNASNELRFQAWLAVGSTVLNVSLSIALTQMIGVSGPAWGSAAALAMVVVLPALRVTAQKIRRLQAGSTAHELDAGEPSSIVGGHDLLGM